MKIEFYLHQIWLALICILMVASLVLPTAQFVNADGASALLTNFRISFIEGDSRAALWGLGVILILTLCVGVFELLLSGFRNFVLQKRLLVFMMLMTAGYYIVYTIYVLVLKGDAQFVPKPGLVFPMVCLVLEFMSLQGVARAEASIIARASGFRLRD